MAEDVHAGEVLSITNLKVIRPGDGLEPKFYESLLGIAVKKQLKKGTPLKLEDLF